jgi:3'-5' exoribonuclease
MDRNRRFVNQLMPGEMIDQVFLIRDKDLRTASSGQLYLVCALCDKTGQIPARMWQVSESIYNGLPVEGFIQVKGRTENYKGTLQLIIDACRPYPAEKVDLAEFLPTTAHDVEEMWGELLEILQGVKDGHLRLLVKKFVEDRQFVERFKRAPAAVQYHHAFIGGLLEHTLMVARAARALLPLYADLNADLVLVGVFLHDAGKAAELGSGPSMSYTDRGALVGHIAIATVWVAEKAQEVASETGEAFPQRTLDLVQHLILSHHGSHEFGSPRLPAIPEAFMVHYLDNLDAKIFMAAQAVAGDPDPKAAFTSFLRQLDTRIYKRSREL